jgi:hypothetical protein
MERLIHTAITAVAGAVVLAACAGAEMEVASQEKLRTATLQAIERLDPATIAISDVSRTPAKISWRVTAGTKSYACDADGFYRLPWCRPDV